MSSSSKSVTLERLNTPKNYVTEIRKVPKANKDVITYIINFPKADKEAKVPAPKQSNLHEK